MTGRQLHAMFFAAAKQYGVKLDRTQKPGDTEHDTWNYLPREAKAVYDCVASALKIKGTPQELVITTPPLPPPLPVQIVCSHCSETSNITNDSWARDLMGVRWCESCGMTTWHRMLRPDPNTQATQEKPNGEATT